MSEFDLPSGVGGWERLLMGKIVSLEEERRELVEKLKSLERIEDRIGAMEDRIAAAEKDLKKQVDRLRSEVQQTYRQR